MCTQKDKDKFGNDVTFLSRPLPVEYLIIDVRPAVYFLNAFFLRTYCLSLLLNKMLLSLLDNYYFSKGPSVHLFLCTALPHREPRHFGRNPSE